MSKKGYEIHKRALKVGAYLTKDKERKDGGLIYTYGAARKRAAQLGKLGAASGVRRIDPKTGEVIEVISRAAIEKAKAKTAPKGGRRPSRRKRK